MPSGTFDIGFLAKSAAGVRSFAPKWTVGAGARTHTKLGTALARHGYYLGSALSLALYPEFPNEYYTPAALVLRCCQPRHVLAADLVLVLPAPRRNGRGPPFKQLIGVFA